ncbi:M56 family metallopeptidase [Pseudoxanthomonas wuyuanensis]
MAIEFISGVLLPRLLAASVQATVLVAVVWMLCRLLPRLSAATRAALWWLVAAQLAIGMLWSSPLALPLLPAGMAESASAVPPQIAAPGLAGGEALFLATATPAPMSAASPSWQWSWMTILAMLWLSGLGLMVVRTQRGYLETRRLLRESRPCRDIALLRALKLAAEAHGLRTPPRLRLSASIASPQLIGPWRPVLLLPDHHPQSMHADELDMALTHELVHLQRGDLWWGLLPALAQQLFFFHPLVHLAVREYALAREAACDATVIAGHRHCARDYGRLLVRLGVAPRPSAGLASASPNFNFLKRRLVMLQDTASTPRVAALFITVAVAVLGVTPYRIVAAPLDQTVAVPAAPSPAAAPIPVTAPVAAVPEVPSVGKIAPPPAPPAAAPAPAPRAAPVPTVPSRAPTPPAPPPPPPAGSTTVTHRIISLSSDSERAYVLLRENNSVMNGSIDDLGQARRLQRNGEDLLWFRDGKARYVVRDPALLARFRSTFDEMKNLGDAQGALGDRQGQLGEQQGRLGMRQGEIGAQLGMLSAEQAERSLAIAAGREPRTANASYREQAAALSAQQHGLAEQMQLLAERQQRLGREQAALGAKQAAAHQRAEREAKKLMDEAIAKRMALPVGG